MNKHSDVINRQTLYEESFDFKEVVGKPLSSYSYEEILNAYLKQHKIEETVSVSSNLVAAKVLSTIIEGASFNGDRWRSLVNLHKLTEEQERIPIFTEDDFFVHKGPNTPAKKQSGGEVVEINFDVTKDNKDRNMWVSFKQRDVDRKKFNLIQNALRVAGKKFARFILDEVVEFGVNNAGSSQALGGDDRFTATTNLVATMEEAGFAPETGAMQPTDFAQVLQTQVGTGGPMPFITNTMIDKSGNAVRNLKKGEDYMLLGYIPGVKVTNTTLAGDILLIHKASLNFGLYQDVQIKNWEDPLKSLRGFEINATYEILSNAKLTNGLGIVTGV